MDAMTDPRPDLIAAHRWVTSLIDGIEPAQATAPTPCSDYDVLALTEHLHAVSVKLRTMGEGGDPGGVPDRIRIDPDQAGQQYAAGAAQARAAWEDDALLTRTVTAPFGQVPGVLALSGFVMETVTHGWDLATATGQDPELDPAVVATAQAVADQTLAGPRGPHVPFDEPVEPPAGAGPTTRLAAFLGRRWS